MQLGKGQLNLYEKERRIFEDDVLTEAVGKRINERQEGYLKGAKIGERLSTAFLVGVIETYNSLSGSSISSSSPTLLRMVLEFITDPKNADKFSIKYDEKIIRSISGTIDDFERGNEAEGREKIRKAKEKSVWGPEAALPPDDK